MSNGKIGAVYTATITLNHTHSQQVEKGPVVLQRCMIYSQTQDAYAGNQSEQNFKLDASDYCGAKCLRMTNIDLSTLYFKAAASGAIIHIFGTRLNE